MKKLLLSFTLSAMLFNCKQKEELSLKETARQNGALRYAAAMLTWSTSNGVWVDTKAIDSIYYSKCPTCIK